MATKFQRQRSKKDQEASELLIQVQKDWKPTREKISSGELGRLFQVVRAPDFAKMAEFSEVVAEPVPEEAPIVEQTISQLIQFEMDRRPKTDMIKNLKESLKLNTPTALLGIGGVAGLAILGFSTGNYTLLTPVMAVLWRTWKSPSWKPLARFSRTAVTGVLTNIVSVQVLGALALVIPGVPLLATIAITATITVVGGEVVGGVIDRVFCLKEEEENTYAQLLAAAEAEWASKYLSWNPVTNTYDYSHWKKFADLIR